MGCIFLGGHRCLYVDCIVVYAYYKESALWRAIIKIFFIEQHEGTASPDATCAATHYGLAAPAHGGVSAPSHHHIFWNIEERLLCTHRFIPASNQSVTIEVSTLFVYSEVFIYYNQ